MSQSSKNTSTLMNFLSTTAGQLTFIGIVLFLAIFLILYSIRQAGPPPQQDSMLDDVGAISKHERLELREIMDEYFGMTGVSLSYHIAELEPKPVRVGPNTFTIGISSRRGTANFRIPRGLKPYLAKSTEDTLADLETRFGLCMELSIDRKIPHCLKDSIIAIQNLTGELEQPLKLQSK